VRLNHRLLVSDADHFRVDYEINPYMSTDDQPDPAAAAAEHAGLVAAHRAAGRVVERMPSAPECPDMVFTANAALVHGRTAVLGRLPAPRRPEAPHHRRWFAEHGYDIVEPEFAFSGQGDALRCGDVLLAGYGRRSDRRAPCFLREVLGLDVVALRTVSDAWYDLDLALAVVDVGVLAWCPAAFDRAGQDAVRGLGMELIAVDEDEARRFALNLVSDGRTVTMTDGAPRLAGCLRERGLDVVGLPVRQLAKGGGGVRCTALSL
jgi:N-dimethylarginine dimethylaminohydrolase